MPSRKKIGNVLGKTLAINMHLLVHGKQLSNKHAYKLSNIDWRPFRKKIGNIDWLPCSTQEKERPTSDYRVLGKKIMN